MFHCGGVCHNIHEWLRTTSVCNAVCVCVCAYVCVHVCVIIQNAKHVKDRVMVAYM